MFAVIFEVSPRAGGKQRYLDIAADLRQMLVDIPGFVSIERFQSLSDPHKLLSLSFWESEAAIRAWRTLAEHRAAQGEGRGGLFADYRIRVAEVVRDYALNDRDEAPLDAPSGNLGPDRSSG